MAPLPFKQGPGQKEGVGAFGKGGSRDRLVPRGWSKSSNDDSPLVPQSPLEEFFFQKKKKKKKKRERNPPIIPPPPPRV